MEELETYLEQNKIIEFAGSGDPHEEKGKVKLNRSRSLMTVSRGDFDGSGEPRDKLAGTPLHRFVPCRVEAV